VPTTCISALSPFIGSHALRTLTQGCGALPRWWSQKGRVEACGARCCGWRDLSPGGSRARVAIPVSTDALTWCADSRRLPEGRGTGACSARRSTRRRSSLRRLSASRGPSTARDAGSTSPSRVLAALASRPCAAARARRCVGPYCGLRPRTSLRGWGRGNARCPALCRGCAPSTPPASGGDLCSGRSAEAILLRPCGPMRVGPPSPRWNCGPLPPTPASRRATGAAPLTLFQPLHPTVGLSMRANQGSLLTKGGRCGTGCTSPLPKTMTGQRARQSPPCAAAPTLREATECSSRPYPRRAPPPSASPPHGV